MFYGSLWGNCAAAKDFSFFIHSNVLKKGKVLKKSIIPQGILLVKTCMIVVQRLML